MANIRIARLLKLITVLRARTARNASDLAGELEVSARTVYRDLNALMLAGVPCHFDRETSGYRINGDFFLPPVQLSLSEAMALSILCGVLAGRRQFPLMQQAWPALTKIRSQLPAAIREELAESDGKLMIQPARVSPQEGCGHYFEMIRKAIAQRRKVRCRYDGIKTRAGAAFLFRPYALFFGQRAWYAIGHSKSRGGERSLKLNRLKDVTPTDFPYMIPDGWTLEKSLGNAWRMIRGDHRFTVR